MRIITLTILLLTSLIVLGQETVELKGRVISKRGSYLPGTNVVLVNTTIGAATDACGQFRIKIPKDRKGHLMLSMISEPFYFDLRQLKDEDLNKEIVIKIIPFKEEKRIRRKKQYDLKHNCKDKIQTVTFKLASRARPKEND